MKVLSVFLLSFFIVAKAFCQDCEVKVDNLKGKYTGDCKKGKAFGAGKAEGVDTYEGNFNEGLPNGKGTYSWKNGNSYTGDWAKGAREGNGTMRYKTLSGTDSVVTGFWKKDAYIGKYEKPFVLYFKSKSIGEVEISTEKNGFNTISFFVTSTSAGATNTEGDEVPKMKVDEVHAVSGTTGRLSWNDVHARRTESIITGASFPCRLKVTIGSEEMEIEFFEAATYKIQVSINL